MVNVLENLPVTLKIAAITLHALLCGADRLHTNKANDNLRSSHDRRHTRDYA